MNLTWSIIKFDWYDSGYSESPRRNLEISLSAVFIVSIIVFWVILMVVVQMLFLYYCKIRKKRGNLNMLHYWLFS